MTQLFDYLLDEVRSERAAQDRTWGGAAHDDKHTPSEWIAILSRHVGIACNDGVPDDLDRFRKQLIRVAAVALAAAESYDRRNGKVILPKSDKGY